VSRFSTLILASVLDNKRVIGSIRNKRARCAPHVSLLLTVVLAILEATTLIGASDDFAPLYIVFFHMQAQGATRSNGGGGAMPEETAARLHIQASELEALRTVAREFVKEEEHLRLEALQYHLSRSIQGEVLDRAVIHSFALRRAALACDAMERLKASLTPESFAGVHQFVTSELSKSITTWR
jgi:hypothetical protein